MEIKISKNKIEIKDAKHFDIKKSLECGQIFRYQILDENHFVVFETNQKIEIEKNINNYIILTKEPKKHLKYFDLETNYDIINKRIEKINPFVKKAVMFGDGIRIFKQDFLETIISFVISANNNISRIRNSLFKLCETFGEKIDDHFAFPTLSALLKITESQWVNLGVGYRAKSLVRICKELIKIKQTDLETIETVEARKKLISLSGVGPKVADCVLLFSLNKKDVFPTDTWIKKVFIENLSGIETDAKKISLMLAGKFKEDSGIIQQYMFYYKREKGDNNG